MKGTTAEYAHQADPRAIKKVDEAIGYVLRSHGINDVYPADVLEKTEHFTADDISAIMISEVFPGSLEVFYPDQKNYHKKLKDWCIDMSQRLYTGVTRSSTYRLIIDQGKGSRISAIAVVDSRGCSKGGCEDSLYISNLVRDVNIFDVNIREKICGKTPAICDRVIGALSAYCMVNINEEQQ